MKKYHHYSSHFPALLHVLSRTTGDVLELGTGLFSTPLLHYMCVPRGRKLVSVDNDPKWLDNVRGFECDLHELILTDDWKLTQLERAWDVVFVDQAPASARRESVIQFSNLAKFIVVHDTNGRQDKHYHLREVWKSFKYLSYYGDVFPATTVVSNFEPIGEIC